MHLSLGDKAHILTSNFSFWIGAFFLFVGFILVSTFLPQTDFESLQFYQQPIALTDGYVAVTEETNYSEDDATIIAIYYRYQVDNRKLVGYSYSNTLSVKRGEKVQVEYLVTQPEHAHIMGTRNAPYALWVGLFVVMGPVIGLTLIYKALHKSKASFAIITDVDAVTGTYKQTRTTNEGFDGSTLYYLVYSYQFYNVTYTCTKEVNDPTEYETKELIFVQRSMPANAIFSTDLPIAIRERLLSLINS